MGRGQQGQGGGRTLQSSTLELSKHVSRWQGSGHTAGPLLEPDAETKMLSVIMVTTLLIDEAVGGEG